MFNRKIFNEIAIGIILLVTLIVVISVSVSSGKEQQLGNENNVSVSMIEKKEVDDAGDYCVSSGGHIYNAEKDGKIVRMCSLDSHSSTSQVATDCSVDDYYAKKCNAIEKLSVVVADDVCKSYATILRKYGSIKIF